MNVFYLVFITLLAHSLDAEEACMVLSVHAKRLRSEEIFKFANQNTGIDIENLHNKIQEDTFNHCLNLISAQESSEIRAFVVPDMSKFTHLVIYPFSKYSSQDELVCSPAFEGRKAEIMLRIVQKSNNEL